MKNDDAGLRMLWLSFKYKIMMNNAMTNSRPINKRFSDAVNAIVV